MYYLNIPNRAQHLEKSHFYSCVKNTHIGFKCSEMVCCVVGLSICDVSTDSVIFIFLDFLNPEDDSTMILQTHLTQNHILQDLNPHQRQCESISPSSGCLLVQVNRNNRSMFSSVWLDNRPHPELQQY